MAAQNAEIFRRAAVMVISPHYFLVYCTASLCGVLLCWNTQQEVCQFLRFCYQLAIAGLI
jgi:hypothetical protein